MNQLHYLTWCLKPKRKQDNFGTLESGNQIKPSFKVLNVPFSKEASVQYKFYQYWQYIKIRKLPLAIWHEVVPLTCTKPTVHMWVLTGLSLTIPDQTVDATVIDRNDFLAVLNWKYWLLLLIVIWYIPSLGANCIFLWMIHWNKTVFNGTLSL